MSGSPAVADDKTTKSKKKNDLSYYSLNVFMATIVFLSVFTTGNAWSMAVNKEFEKKPDKFKYWMFALGMTLLMMAIAIGFGEISSLLKGKVAPLNPQSFIEMAV